MAILIVEGVDFSGKTTLVNRLQKDLNLFTLKSPRPKTPADVTHLISKTERLGEGMDLICDRISLISEPIYGPICRPQEDSILGTDLGELMLEGLQPIIIWCCPPWDHVRTCNNDQMAGVKEKLEQLYMAYQDWMNGELMQKFIIVPYDFTTQTYESLRDDIEGYLDYASKSVQADKELMAVEAFHLKFGVPMPLFAQLMGPEALEFRLKFLREEVNELEEAHAEGDIVKAFDALIDIVYVAKGSATFMGIDGVQWASGFDAVQNANMNKRRANNAQESKRGTALDVVKPEGWESPEPHLKRILGV